MERLSRYGRRMRITLIKTMTVACFVCIIAIPFLSKKLLKTEANYYSITINGIKVEQLIRKKRLLLRWHQQGRNLVHSMKKSCTWILI